MLNQIDANTLVVFNFITLAGLVLWVARQSFNLGQLTLKVETVWDFLIKRAKVEFVQAGLGTMNSPVTLFPESFEKASAIVDRILPVYIDILVRNPAISEKELFIEFEVRFSDYMVETLCIPNGIALGACIVWLMKACKVKAGEEKPNGRVNGNAY